MPKDKRDNLISRARIAAEKVILRANAASSAERFFFLRGFRTGLSIEFSIEFSQRDLEKDAGRPPIGERSLISRSIPAEFEERKAADLS